MSILTNIFSRDQIYSSYDFIEVFIRDNVTSWDTPPDTPSIVDTFSSVIGALAKEEFALLLIHAGYIPELYLPDSSQETLYSKLIEVLVCEWAKRIGFKDSFLQTQKSNKEDVTLKKGNKVIVCDAKSFRLGRSQAAPNVKDTIKKQAYTTWLEQYPVNSRIGGLVTFPSLHDWKKGSEAYLYFTGGSPAIMMLFYEQMAFMLMYHKTAQDIINFLKSYSLIYPNASQARDIYWKGVEANLFGQSKVYLSFMKDSSKIIKGKVSYVIRQMEMYLSEVRNMITLDVEKMTLEEIKKSQSKHSLTTNVGISNGNKIIY